MKKKKPFHPLPLTAFAVIAFAMSPSAHAQSSWDGGSLSANSWGTPENWVDDVAPSFGTTTDLVFNNLTRPDNDIGNPRTVRSITFGADMDDAFTINNRNFTPGGAAQQLTFQADAGNATLSVDANATGNISIGWNGVSGSTVGGAIGLSSNLDIIHNGSGNLTFSRGLTGSNGFTKTGNGTMIVSNFPSNNFTGAANFNAGTSIFGNTNTSGAGSTPSGDFLSASAVNLGGGTLEIRTAAGNKILTNNSTVSQASTLAYNNTNTTTSRTLTLNTGSLVLDADLTLRNISAAPITGGNTFIINRNMTGAADLIVRTYNNISASSTDFATGRVALGGNNSDWSGDLIVREGTAQLFGDTALSNFNAGAGDIILGETGNTFGAGFLLSASTPTAGGKTVGNDIIVRSGGFRSLRGNSDHTYTLSGNITLEGDLNLHNGLFFTDKFLILTGNISGAGQLNATKGNSGASIRLSGNNSLWSGGLSISQGTVEIRGTSDTSAGTGPITIGATADAAAAVLTFVPGAPGGSSLTFENSITVASGGSRSINGGDSNHNVTLEGAITLNGDLNVNHAWSTSDRRFNLNGPISGNGGLTVTRTYGNTETTVRMAGTKAYLGTTTVAATASLALASDCVLTSSNVVVQGTGRIGGPGTIGGNLTLNNTANFYFFVGALNPGTYVPMKVNGTVTVDASFGVASIVGGSRGEAVPWATIPDGTYTLISNTASTFNSTANFGSANAVANVAGSGKTVYFQNGGGSGSGGLQIVVAPDAVDPYATWSGGAAFNDDANNDGLQNGLAFLLGAANVNSNVAGLLPVPSQGSGDLTLTFAMRNSAARGTAALQVQHSSDLGISDPWSTLVTVPDASGTEGGIVFTVTPGTAPLNNVTATIPASGNAAGGKLFGRVRGNP